VLDRSAVLERYLRVRADTEALAAPLSAEDMGVQSMPDASPTKWHLAHTTWFFEEFVLARFMPGHAWPDERWRVLFNSYYESVGPRHARPSRGLLSRPSLDDVRGWRARVDRQMRALIAEAEPAGADLVLGVVLLGTHHEEQHQELILTDVKHALSGNPLRPAYAPPPRVSVSDASRVSHEPVEWVEYDERIARIGHEGDGFAFDNEGPAHRVLVGPFRLATRLVTNGEYARFVDEGGYDRPEFWLSAGYAECKSQGWIAPLYWERARLGGGCGAWRSFTLHGMQPLDPRAPVAHVSYFEADAYARWAGARLPTEEEWEVAAHPLPVDGNFIGRGVADGAGLEPRAAAPPRGARGDLQQMFGDLWQWTSSAYSPYPRFQPLAGSLGEYNAKFMSGQMTLRGGSCFSPRDHLRATYRNFFPPAARWQMTGLRLARDVG
jgi:ergothioneine biosynthesis protein EgtB